MEECAHVGHRKRLKEQFLDHGDGFATHQLMELLLYYALPRSDVNELAHTLVNKFGGLSGVLDAFPEALMQTEGVSLHTAVLLKLIPQLFGRYMAEKNKQGIIISSSSMAANLLRPYFHRGTRNELTYILCMDAKHKVLGIRQLDDGTVSSADIPPRKVAEIALALNATSVIVAHNHPSGIALPSNADIAVTRNLFAILREMEIHLEDHLIFADNNLDESLTQTEGGKEGRSTGAVPQYAGHTDAADGRPGTKAADFDGTVKVPIPNEEKYDDVVSMRDSGMFASFLR